MAGVAINAAAGFHRQGRPNARRPLTRDQRRRIEDLIEHFLALLDEDDGEPDLEPSFGQVAPGYLDECEQPEDDEPSLGWSATYATTRFDAVATLSDLEEGFAAAF
jgi:hypothetical protein